MPDSYSVLLSRFPEWLPLLGITAALSCGLTALLYVAAMKLRLLPAIRSRDVHAVRKPRVGGVAMWCSVVLVLIFLLLSTHSGLLHSPHADSRWGIEAQMLGIFEGLLVILAFGLLDDIFSLSPWLQLLGQFLAATAVMFAGIQPSYLNLPHFGLMQLSGSVGALFTYVWVIVMINVMNFFDGLDGLAGSIAVTAGSVLFLLCIRLGLVLPATLALVTAAAALGFLPWNWSPSRIFMGTVGSQLLGFLLAVVAIISGGKVATAVLVLGIPVLDAIVVIGRRLLAHQSPFHADQRHLHHRLLNLGLTAPQVVLIINAFAVAFGLFALGAQGSAEKGLLTLLLIACMILVIAVTYLLERRRKQA